MAEQSLSYQSFRNTFAASILRNTLSFVVVVLRLLVVVVVAVVVPKIIY